MTNTVATSKPAAVTAASGRARPEALERWAEGRIKPGARVVPLSSGARAETNHAASDYFVSREGRRYAGTHLLIDLWGATRLDDLAHVEATLRAAVHAVGATLLDLKVHHFTPNDGVSGIAVLAESHISIHTWPERGYAALDIFVCGTCDPHAAVPVLRRAWRPEEVIISEHRRGLAE